MKLENFKNVKIGEAKAALKNLEGVQKLLANEENWTKGVFNDEVEDDNGKVTAQYCVIGAVHEVDGSGEVLATEILANIAFDGRKTFDTDGEILESDNVANVYYFNDYDDTSHKDIKKFLSKAVKFTKKLIDSKRKK